MVGLTVDSLIASVEGFQGRLSAELSVEHLGFEQLGDLSDPQQRAVVSDQLISSVDAVVTNLREASEHAALLIEIVGPNGRAMPDPQRPEELQALRDLDRELVGVFRAVGSTVDCLAAVAVVVLRLPESVQRADGGVLNRIQSHADAAGGDKEVCWSSAFEAFESIRAEGEQGWFEWSLEMRNAVIHRARQLRILLPRPSIPIPESARLIVPTETPPARLIRYELHLRRKPWLPDLEALAVATEAAENWLPEPASITVRVLLERLESMVDSVMTALADTWDQIATDRLQLDAPAHFWRLTEPSERSRLAGQFGGFNSAYPVPPLTSIITSPREAKRAQIAETLRTI